MKPSQMNRRMHFFDISYRATVSVYPKTSHPNHKALTRKIPALRYYATRKIDRSMFYSLILVFFFFKKKDLGYVDPIIYATSTSIT